MSDDLDSIIGDLDSTPVEDKQKDNPPQTTQEKENSKTEKETKSQPKEEAKTEEYDEDEDDMFNLDDSTNKTEKETKPEPKEEKKIESKETKKQTKQESSKETKTVSNTPKAQEEPQSKTETKVEKYEQDDFQIQEDLPSAKHIISVFGNKGSGKTAIALSFPGTIAALSADNKTAIVKQEMYGNDQRIHVFNVMKYMDYHNQQTTVQSASKTYDFMLAILKHVRAKIKPDWILFDASEYIQQLCEWKMRSNHDLDAYEGISNRNLWKERRTLLRQLHNDAYDIAQKGIIYTMYSDKDELVIEGEIVAKKDVPKWIDIIMTETDFVIKADYDLENKQHKAIIVTSKADRVLPTGAKYNVEGKRFWEVVEEVKKADAK